MIIWLSIVVLLTCANVAVYAQCVAGTYDDGGVCTQCAAGTYSDSDGAASCSDCAAGKASSQGATVCSSCSSGYYIVERRRLRVLLSRKDITP